MHLSQFPALRVLVPYCSGILSGYLGVFSPDGNQCLAIVPVFLSGMLIGQVWGKGRSLIPMLLFWTATTGALFFCGCGSIASGKYKDPGLPVDTKVVVCGRIIRTHENHSGRMVYNMEVQMVSTPDSCMNTRFRARCYPGSGNDSIRPETGERWIFTGRFLPISNAGNPGETDFAAVMERQNTWYTFLAEGPEFFNHPMEKDAGPPFREVLKHRIASHWTGDSEAGSLLRALCLGDRSGLGPGLTESFSRAGGMHLLAVSGLHVGLIWWVLHRLFYLLVAVSGKEITRFIPVLLILWIYAWLSGFSSPVLRSVIMFSLYSFSRLLSWRVETLNVVFIAMLLLIAADPMRIFQAGFQLSFSAVLAILTLQPFLRSLWSPAGRLVRWIWDATTLSLAAQAGTFPLVLYYFQQFPVYSILTTLLTVPLLSGIMLLFVAGFPFLVWGTATGPVGGLMLLQARIMIRILETIASFPGALITGLCIDAAVALACSLLVLLLVLFLTARRVRNLILCGAALGLLVVLSTVHRQDLVEGRETVVMNFRGMSMITFREGNLADHYLWSGDDGSVVVADRYLEKAFGQRTFDNSVIRVCPGPQIREFPGQISSCLRISTGTWCVGNDRFRVMVVSGEENSFPDPRILLLHPDLVVLREEPGLDESYLRQLISEGNTVIADGSNGSWYLVELAEYKDKIYITPSRGAFRADY